jgi:two-component system response regulator AtoC
MSVTPRAGSPATTGPVSETLPDNLLEELHREGKRRVVLFLLHKNGAEMAPLTPGVAVVVGRKAPSDVCIPDAKLSRTHARFSLSDDGLSVTVEDLKSTNGTWLGTRRIQTAQLSFGQEVRLSGVLARPQVFGDAPAAARADAISAQQVSIVAGKAMHALIETVERVASSRVPVILHGETGTGKEVLAGLLHKRGPRSDKPMVRVNCGAIPQHLTESTFFGHERGAFTGAVQQHRGVFEEAHGGLVFLDEIGELAPAAQTALLRVLEAGKLTRVGGSREISVDVRVIAATHRDLDAMVQRGLFREDLYYRLSTLTIELPPLRERTDEIEPLALHFLRQANVENAGRIKGLSPGALERLLAYHWPGNVRELRNVIERAALVSRSNYIAVGDLPAKVLKPRAAEKASASAEAVPSAEDSTEELPSAEPVEFDGEYRSLLQRYEAQLIRQTLQAAQWKRAVAARRLGMPLRTLAHKIKVLGIKKDPS